MIFKVRHLRRSGGRGLTQGWRMHEHRDDLARPRARRKTASAAARAPRPASAARPGAGTRATRPARAARSPLVRRRPDADPAPAAQARVQEPRPESSTRSSPSSRLAAARGAARSWTATLARGADRIVRGRRRSSCWQAASSRWRSRCAWMPRARPRRQGDRGRRRHRRDARSRRPRPRRHRGTHASRSIQNIFQVPELKQRHPVHARDRSPSTGWGARARRRG